MNNKDKNVRKAIAFFCATAITFFSSTAYASANNSVRLTYNGSEILFPDAKPYIDDNSRTMVPVRFVAESMNVDVKWEEDGKKDNITLTKGSIRVNIKIGDKFAEVNGEQRGLDTCAVLLENRTYVPLRFLSELIGTNIAWDSDNNTVVLSDGTSRGGDSDIRNEYGTSILSSPRATVEQAKAWAASKGATDVFVNMADIVWKVAPNAGVDPTVVYCQSAKETRFGKFGGVLDESFRNPCGLKTQSGGSNYDKEAHQRFGTWEEGIMAQVDHLALYAGAAGYPKTNTTDPRHFKSLFGTAKTVESLGGKWAGSSTYGIDIVNKMNEVIATQVN